MAMMIDQGHERSLWNGIGQRWTVIIDTFIDVIDGYYS